MATQEQLESWANALEVLRLHKANLKEPDVSLVMAYEKELENLKNDMIKN
jgi:hypothetical protein